MKQSRQTLRRLLPLLVSSLCVLFGGAITARGQITVTGVLQNANSTLAPRTTISFLPQSNPQILAPNVVGNATVSVRSGLEAEWAATLVQGDYIMQWGAAPPYNQLRLSITNGSGTFGVWNFVTTSNAFVYTSPFSTQQLPDLTDVGVAGTPDDGDVLTWLTALGGWTNQPPTGGGGGITLGTASNMAAQVVADLSVLSDSGSGTNNTFVDPTITGGSAVPWDATAAGWTNVRGPISRVVSAWHVSVDEDVQDSDDQSTLASVFAYERRGNVVVGPFTTPTSRSNAPYSLRATAEYYERPGIVIATNANPLTVAGQTALGDRVVTNYAKQFDWINTGGFSDVVEADRRWLVSIPDGTGVKIYGGQGTNFWALHDSPADGISGLTGAELLKLKLRGTNGLLVVGGEYPVQVNGEFNFYTDGPSAARWTTYTNPATDVPVTFIGEEVGNTIKSGRSIPNAHNESGPIYDAYNYILNDLSLGTWEGGRGNWGGLAAALAADYTAVEAAGLTYSNGFNSVTTLGTNTFTGNATGPHRFVIAPSSPAALNAKLEAAHSYAPGFKGTGFYKQRRQYLYDTNGNVAMVLEVQDGGSAVVTGAQYGDYVERPILASILRSGVDFQAIQGVVSNENFMAENIYFRGKAAPRGANQMVLTSTNVDSNFADRHSRTMGFRAGYSGAEWLWQALDGSTPLRLTNGYAFFEKPIYLPDSTTNVAAAWGGAGASKVIANAPAADTGIQLGSSATAFWFARSGGTGAMAFSSDGSFKARQGFGYDLWDVSTNIVGRFGVGTSYGADAVGQEPVLRVNGTNRLHIASGSGGSSQIIIASNGVEKVQFVGGSELRSMPLTNAAAFQPASGILTNLATLAAGGNGGAPTNWIADAANGIYQWVRATNNINIPHFTNGVNANALAPGVLSINFAANGSYKLTFPTNRVVLAHGSTNWATKVGGLWSVDLTSDALTRWELAAKWQYANSNVVVSVQKVGGL